MRALDIKLLRDLRRLWGQGLAIGAITALGTALFVMSLGTIQALEATRDAYYEHYRFADVFASVKRAPESLARKLAAIADVRWVRTRITRNVVLDVPGVAEPVNGLVSSLPTADAIHLRRGRLAASGSETEVVLTEPFAEAHALAVGDSLTAVINGRRRRLSVVGVALSPEYVFFGVPGAMVPDDERFGVLWMDRKALASAFDLERAFNDVVLGLTHRANEAEVIAQVDALLAPYGGIGAYGRRDQVSHATLTGEIEQLRASILIAAPMFIGIVAFMLHTLMLRHVETEREHIGMLKALGRGNLDIALHYIKLVSLIVSPGLAVGLVLGAWGGAELTERYAAQYRFPFLDYALDARILVVAAAAQLPAALLGAVGSVRRAVRLQPAVAMRPPPPPVYRRTTVERWASAIALDQPTRMILRHIVRWPLRSLTTMTGIAAATAILVAPMGVLDSADFMIDTHFFRAERQDMTLAFAQVRPYRAVDEVRRLPGVLQAEPFRATSAEIRFGQRARRITILGRDGLPELARPLDHRLAPLSIPDQGLVLSESMARWLGVGRGERVAIRLFESDRPPQELPVTAIAESYVGLTFFTLFMDRRLLNRLMDEDDVVTGVQLRIDPAQASRLYAELKATPSITGALSQQAALTTLRRMVDQNLYIALINSLVAAVIVFGVVYNTARTAFSERITELAGMRLLGYSRFDVAYVLAGETIVLALLALPLGLALGRGLAYLMTEGTANPMFRLPLHLQSSAYGYAILVVAATVALSVFAMGRQLDRVDIVSVMKSRE
jgi:putative ABC transport system permease protein